MAKESIASAYVQIIPTTEGISDGIAKALGSGQVKAAGGKALGNALGAGATAVGAKALGLINPFTMAAAAVGAVGKASVETGRDFDASMSHVYSLMSSVNDGTGLTADEMARLRDRAREMGASTQFTASEVADAMGYMALAGWKVDEVYEHIPAVLNLAAASQMDLGRASDIVTDYMSAFSRTAPEAAQMADVLAYAQANSNATTDQFAEAWKYTGQSMNMSGQSIETTTALLARMANQGTKASSAGTQLNAMYTSLVKAMDRNGNVTINGQTVALADAEGHWRNMIDIIGDVQGVMSDIDENSPEYAAALMGTFGNVRAMRGVASLLNGDVEAMRTFEAELYNAGGAAEEQAKVVNDNLTGDLKILKSATDEVGISISDLLTPALRKGTQLATGFMQGFGLLVNGKGAEGAATQSISEIVAGFDQMSDVDYETIGRRIDGIIQKLADPGISEDDKGSLLAALAELVSAVSNTDDTTEAGKNAMEGIAAGMLHYDFEDSQESIKTNIVNAINSALNNAGWETTGAIPPRGIGRGISNNKSKMTTPAKQAIDAVKTKARDEIGQDGSKFNAFGADIAKGIAKGVSDGESGLEEAINKIIDDALAAAREHAGVNSPSRLFAEQLGRWIPMGVAEGVSRYAGDAVDAVDDMTGALLSGNAALLSTTNGAAARGGFVQNVTINSPRALSPLEVARQTRNATRRFVEGIT